MKTIPMLTAEREELDRALEIGKISAKQRNGQVTLINTLIHYLERNVSEDAVKVQLNEVMRQIDFLNRRCITEEAPKGVKNPKKYFERMYDLPLLRKQRRTLTYLLK